MKTNFKFNIKLLYFLKSLKYFSLFTIHYSLFTIHLFSQDIHFTQFNNSPLNLNPAATGLFYGDYRISLIDRNQWNSITQPYQTFSAAFDTKLLNRTYHKDMLGFGVVFYRDKAGDSDFGTSEASLSLSYTKSIDNHARHFLTFGLQGGCAQKTLDYSKLTFDNQYNGNYFDPNIAPNEPFSRNNFLYPDISAGINWLFFVKERLNINCGISVYHINQPNQSFLDNSNSKLNPRISAYINMETNNTYNISLMPSILYMNQENYQEINFGALLKIYLDKSITNPTSLNLGLYDRETDALNVVVGIDYRNFTVGLSYDFNYSKLQPASKSQGGWELSAIYRIFKKNRKINPIKPCNIM